MSEYGAYLFRLDGEKIVKHPNADSLSLYNLENGKSVVFRTDLFNPLDRALHIQPETIVNPKNENFISVAEGSFEKEFTVGVQKIRGIYSYGMFLKIKPDVSILHSNLWEFLGFEHLQPKEPKEHEGINIGLSCPIFDVENLFNDRYVNNFSKEDLVVITEKIHGSSTRAVNIPSNSNLYNPYFGSRRNWYRNENPYEYQSQIPGLKDFLNDNPGIVVYGEVFGMVQSIRYGKTRDNPFGWAMFDMWNSKTEQWLNYDQIDNFANQYSIPRAPFLYRGAFMMSVVRILTDGPSRIDGSSLREGVVVRCVYPGKMVYGKELRLKSVNDDYLLVKNNKIS
jgi:RNA ligase (TIGR02306 family)